MGLVVVYLSPSEGCSLSITVFYSFGSSTVYLLDYTTLFLILSFLSRAFNGCIGLQRVLALI